MKRFLLASLSLISASCFAFAPQFMACPQAVSTADPGFCASFKSVAQCQCVSRGLPAGMCQDMSQLYSRMVGMFGSVEKACEYQASTSHDTTKQQCIDDWNCYRSGGSNASGLCSSTGHAC